MFQQKLFWLVFWKTKDLYLIITQKLIILKSSGFHEIWWISCGFHVKSGRFHEILGHSPHPAFIKLKSFCWNTCFYNFGWISQVISGWNPLDFTGQICQISGWTLLDFTGQILGHSPYPAFIKLKSFCWNTCFYNLGGFHRWNLPDFMGEIHQISGWISWNPWS